MKKGILSSQTTRFQITPTQPLVTTDQYFDLGSKAPAAFWDAVSPSGGDVRVYAQDGTTRCARQVSGFSRSGKTGSLWIAGAGKTSFWVESGSGVPEPAPLSAYGARTTWEADAQIVCHFEDFTDSSRYNRTLTPGTSELVPGEVQTAVQDTDPNGPCVDTDYVAQLAGDFTVLLWFKATDLTNLTRLSETNFATGFWMGKSGTAWGEGIMQSAPPYGSWVNLSNGDWHHLVLRRTGTTEDVIGDGGAATATAVVSGDPLTSATPVRIGAGLDGQPRGTRPVDEYRIYTRAVSDAEIAQLVSNQGNPDAFWTVGPAL